MNKKFYITTAIPYVNAAPHIGHALEFTQGDVIARYHRLLGDEVLFLCGGDENALKNVQAAEKAGIPIKEFVDKNNQLYFSLTQKLKVQYDIWQKGSDPVHHFPSSQKLWELCAKAGEIYKKSYEGLYCLGCEAFYTQDELNENGECFEHPGRKLEKVTEENYFFRLSNYQQKLIDLISSDTLSIVPEKRKNEVLAFLKRGLNDISISRSNERAKNWGVPVPNDPSQRIYVWFDALNIYQSGIGFGWNENRYSKWWPADVHVIGKGITRFHAVYWPAFLLSAKLALPKKIFVHEYFTVNGQKMSKTLGNVIDPFALITKYGADPLRYYFLAKFSPFSDGDFSEEEFKKIYNADLANGLGNLVARLAKLSSTVNLGTAKEIKFNEILSSNENSFFLEALNDFKFNEALDFVWKKIKSLDKNIDESQPWKITGKDLDKFLEPAKVSLLEIATLLLPFIPETADKILKQFQGPTITSQPPLFPRL